MDRPNPDLFGEHATMIVLPVRLGDTLYRVCPWNGCVEEMRVSMLMQKADGTWKFRATEKSTGSSMDSLVSAIGRVFFHTREEANAAMADAFGTTQGQL